MSGIDALPSSDFLVMTLRDILPQWRQRVTRCGWRSLLIRMVQFSPGHRRVLHPLHILHFHCSGILTLHLVPIRIAIATYSRERLGFVCAFSSAIESRRLILSFAMFLNMNLFLDKNSEWRLSGIIVSTRVPLFSIYVS